MLVTLAAAPPTVTTAPAKFVPLIVIAVPEAPLDGKALVIVGGNVGVGKTIAVPQPPVWIFRVPAL